MSGNGSLKNKESLSEEQLSVLKQKSAKIERLETDITNLSKPLLLGDDAKEKSWMKHVTPGVLTIFQDDSSWNKLTMKPGDQLSKQQHSQELQKATGSSWKKVKDVLTTDISDGDDSTSESEPATTKLNYRDMKTYGNLPMQDEMAVVNCDSCQRPILASSFKKHLDNCMKKGNNNVKVPNRKTATNTDHIKKKTSNQHFFSDNDDGEEGDGGDDEDDDDDDHMGTSKKSNNNNKETTTTVKKKKKLVKGNNGNTADEDTTNNNNISSNNDNNENDTSGNNIGINMKRPPTDTADKTDKKKIKKEKTKTKGTKQKAPLDLDKQCGVIQQPNGLPCTRSLTCKSHSMGAKRAVAGRSQPYDVLLAAYQKKAIGRPQAGTIGGLVGKNAKSKKPSSPAPGNGTNLNHSGTVNSINMNNMSNNNANSTTSLSLSSTSSSSSSSAAAAVGTTTGNGGANNEDYFDSDEEVENVMQALRSNHPIPLAQKPYFYVKRQRQCYRLRDILLEAITPKVKSVDSIQRNPISTQTNGNPALMTSVSSHSGPSVTTATSHNDFAFYNKAYPYQDGRMVSRNNINLQQPPQQQRSSNSSTSSSPINGTIGYPGIYNSSPIDGLSPTSPNTYSIR
ncbi:SCA7, zinc-binding domain-containing protein [Chlamydoabsidia padenii]|nr:SCA7, zinc-binding domain-containing protein [Chlamydoabsidia padenii]